MAVLTTKQRKRFSKKTFALPKERKYPIPDLIHARNALARVSQFGTPEEKRKVARAVRRKFPAFAKRSEFIRNVLKKRG